MLSSLLCFSSTCRIKLCFQDSTSNPVEPDFDLPARHTDGTPLASTGVHLMEEKLGGTNQMALMRKQVLSLWGLSVHHFMPHFLLYSWLSLMVDVRVSLPVCISSGVTWSYISHMRKDGTCWVIVSKMLFLLCLHCHIIKMRMIPTPQRHCKWIQ